MYYLRVSSPGAINHEMPPPHRVCYWPGVLIKCPSLAALFLAGKWDDDPWSPGLPAVSWMDAWVTRREHEENVRSSRVRLPGLSVALENPSFRDSAVLPRVLQTPIAVEKAWSTNECTGGLEQEYGPECDGDISYEATTTGDSGAALQVHSRVPDGLNKD